MHAEIFLEFDRICDRAGAGGDVLEIGAVPAPDTLLCLPSIATARYRVGVSLSDAGHYRDFDILRMDSNDMGEFESGSFDTILCNAMLEHDRFFWKTLSEIRRVARPHALVVIGVPGFVPRPGGKLERLLGRVARFGILRPLGGARLEAWAASTPTLVIHDYPFDCYRFSTQSMREVLLEGMEEIEIKTLLNPPRIVGFGFRRP